METPRLIAKPRLAEWFSAAFFVPLLAFMLSAMVFAGVRYFFPVREASTNRAIIAVIFFSILIPLIVWTYRTNRARVHKLYADRLEVGRYTISLSAISRVRVGAPMAKFARGAHKANEVLGKVSAKNRNAANWLAQQYAGTVVLDLGERDRHVINLATVGEGAALLRALTAGLEVPVEQPGAYSPREIELFGKFRPGAYSLDR